MCKFFPRRIQIGIWGQKMDLGPSSMQVYTAILLVYQKMVVKEDKELIHKRCNCYTIQNTWLFEL